MASSISHDRRRFVIYTASLFGISACASLPGDIWSGLTDVFLGDIPMGCSDHELDPRLEVCGVGFSKEELNKKRVDAWQQMPQWCWAACIQMAFRFHGHEVSQEKIVRSTYGTTDNLPAFGWQIHKQLSRSWKDDKGIEFRAESRTLVDWQRGLRGSASTGNRIHKELSEGRPLILGTGGHAMLLVAQEANVRRSSGRALDIRRATVIDPWPLRLDNDQYKSLRPGDIPMTQFLATVEVS